MSHLPLKKNPPSISISRCRNPKLHLNNIYRRCRNHKHCAPTFQQKSKEISELLPRLDEADVLVRKMDIKARSLQASVKAMLLVKLCEYKSDITKWKREVKKLPSAKSSQTTHEELLESRIANSHMANADQRDRLMMSTKRLNQLSERIKDSWIAVFETEEPSVSILQDMHQHSTTRNTSKFPCQGNSSQNDAAYISG